MALAVEPIDPAEDHLRIQRLRRRVEAASPIEKVVMQFDGILGWIQQSTDAYRTWHLMAAEHRIWAAQLAPAARVACAICGQTHRGDGQPCSPDSEGFRLWQSARRGETSFGITIFRAITIITELHATLNIVDGGTVAQQLDRFYSQLLPYLYDAWTTRSTRSLEIAQRMVREVREAFVVVAHQHGAPAAPVES